jgi:hypothetical protein
MARALSGRWLAILLLAGMAAGCDDEPPTTPTPPTVPVTETFTGQIAKNGAVSHNFSTATSGAVTAKLVALEAADDTVVVNFALGTWASDACNLTLANPAAAGGAVLTGTITGAGTFCALITDGGKIGPTPIAYTIEVTHP